MADDLDRLAGLAAQGAGVDRLDPRACRRRGRAGRRPRRGRAEARRRSGSGAPPPRRPPATRRSARGPPRARTAATPAAPRGGERAAARRRIRRSPRAATTRSGGSPASPAIGQGWRRSLRDSIVAGPIPGISSSCSIEEIAAVLVPELEDVGGGDRPDAVDRLERRLVGGPEADRTRIGRRGRRPRPVAGADAEPVRTGTTTCWPSASRAARLIAFGSARPLAPRPVRPRRRPASRRAAGRPRAPRRRRRRGRRRLRWRPVGRRCRRARRRAR